MQTIFEYTRDQLKDLFTEREIRSNYLLMTEKITGLSRTEIIISKNTFFSTEQHNLLDTFIAKLKNSEPIQYILGETEFYGLNLKVNPSVLIPRSETEELVAWIEKENLGKQELKILDIGTGSGCIAISLKNIFRDAEVTAFDVSKDALETAEKNATLNNLFISFNLVDIFANYEFPDKWDIIVSNPPYVPLSEKAEILPNVLNYEPHLALFVPENDPLIFYKQIVDFALKHLKSNGKLYFEIHRDAGTDCVNLLNNSGFKNVMLQKDMFGNDRMISSEI